MDLGAGPLAAINPGNERCLTVTHGHVLEDKGQAGACPDRTRARDRRAPECRFMAHLLITDDAVTIDMSRGERFEAAHGVQAFPRSAITGVRAVPDCIAEVHGLKWAGTELPGIRVGSSHEDQRVTFAVCHGHNPGIVIDLANGKYDRVVLTVENPEEIAARLSSRS